MNLAWYINRLRAMSPPEMLHRVREIRLKKAARDKLEGWERYASDGPVPTIPGFSLGAVSEADRALILGAADAILAGRFGALGQDWPAFDLNGAELDGLWSLDPVTGKAWDGGDSYTFDISYRHRKDIGDIKYVWEFNRLQFLQPLAAAHALTGDAGYLSAIETVIESWHRVNPPFRGIGWNSGIELALRTISLLVTSSLCGSAMRPETVRLLRQLLAAHAFWLSRYPSRFSSANNHLVAELAAELLLGLSVPGLENAAHLVANARGGLDREALLQIFSDGAPAEQSPTYGAFTCEFMLVSAAAARAAGQPLAQATEDRLEAFAGFIATLSDDRGTVPGLGDDDEGKVLTLCLHEERYAASVAACVAGYLGSPPKGPVPFPRDLREVVFAAPVTGYLAQPGLTTFPEGGMSQWRGQDGLRVLMDHGPLGYLSIAAHGNADANALCAWVGDRPLLVDPGTYLYHSGGIWRDWFRGTPSHSTLNINGEDQSIISGPFNWSHKAGARLLGTSEGPDWSIEAEHDGYEKRFGVRHRRRIFASREGFSVTDRLTGSPDKMAGKPVEIAWQLPVGASAGETSGGIEITDAMGFLARMILPEGGTVEIRSGIGETPGQGGWVSPRFGEKIPAPRIAWHGPVPESGVTTRIEVGEP